MLLRAVRTALSRAAAPRGSRGLAVRTVALDHVCVCVTDIEASIGWYRGVLSLNLRHGDEPRFYPNCASVRPTRRRRRRKWRWGRAAPTGRSDAANLRPPRRAFALRVDRPSFASGARLAQINVGEHRVHSQQSIGIEQFDYGIQRSLFF